MNALQTILIAAGIMFIMVGMAIAISENPAYSGLLAPVYMLCVISFYGFLVAIFLAILISVVEMFGKSRFGGHL